MNNKKIGTEFEKEFCNLLNKKGYWVHFITPDITGSQPFDVVAAKDGKPYAFDCKTNSNKWFNMNRLEDNQKMAFDKWIERGNGTPFIAIKYKEDIYCIPYFKVKNEERINLENYEVYRWK